MHYADLSHLPFFPGLVKHMASGPVVAMVSGENSIYMFDSVLVCFAGSCHHSYSGLSLTKDF